MTRPTNPEVKLPELDVTGDDWGLYLDNAKEGDAHKGVEVYCRERQLIDALTQLQQARDERDLCERQLELVNLEAVAAHAAGRREGLGEAAQLCLQRSTLLGQQTEYQQSQGAFDCYQALKILLATPAQPDRDACQICHGAKGGVPGNENIVDGVTICDYCHAERKPAQPDNNPMDTHGLIVEWDDEDRFFVARIKEFPAISGHGNTRELAIAMVEDNYRNSLEEDCPQPERKRHAFKPFIDVSAGYVSCEFCEEKKDAPIHQVTPAQSEMCSKCDEDCLGIGPNGFACRCVCHKPAQPEEKP